MADALSISKDLLELGKSILEAIEQVSKVFHAMKVTRPISQFAHHSSKKIGKTSANSPGRWSKIQLSSWASESITLVIILSWTDS